MRATIKRKLWIFSSTYFLLTILLVGIIVWQYWEDLTNDVIQTRETLYEKYDQMIRYQVQTAHSLLAAVHKKVQSSELTEDQGKTLMKELLRQIRYGDNNNEYIFLFDANGYLIAHPNPKVEGTHESQHVDANGIYYIKELRQAALSGKGYVDYSFPKLGETNPSPKRSYSKLFEPYGWVLGTGLYVDDIEAAIAKTTEHAIQAKNALLIQILLFVLVIIVLIIIIQRLIHNEISDPIMKVAKEAAKIGEGDFAISIDSRWQKVGGEIEKLANAFQRLSTYIQTREQEIIAMSNADFTGDIPIFSEKDSLGHALRKLKENLANLISEVRNTVEQFNLGAEQLSRASQSLSQGSSEQASSIEEITSALTEVNAQTKQNAEKATRAKKLTQDVLAMAENSQHSMQNLVEVMQRLNASAEEINHIVKTIDDIAFQINLLALNANVEAARAGKYGKGFAVVADEVRNLAVKSANSVKETTAKVRDIVSSITRGHEVTSEVASQIEKIYTNMHETIEASEEVAASSQEQLLSMEQINQGIHQINQVTQSTASSAEETASAAEELASQATVLKRLVAQFKVATTLANQSSPQPAPASPSPYIENVNHEIALSTPPKRTIKLDDSDFGKF